MYHNANKINEATNKLNNSANKLTRGKLNHDANMLHRATNKLILLGLVFGFTVKIEHSSKMTKSRYGICDGLMVG
jgi:pantothenate kinase type III